MCEDTNAYNSSRRKLNNSYRVSNNFLNFIINFLLDFRITGQTVQKPTEGTGCRVIPSNEEYNCLGLNFVQGQSFNKWKKHVKCYSCPWNHICETFLGGYNSLQVVFRAWKALFSHEKHRFQVKSTVFIWKALFSYEKQQKHMCPYMHHKHIYAPHAPPNTYECI